MEKVIVSVTIDPGCILCAWCVSICPEVFEFPPYRQGAAREDQSARLTADAARFFLSHSEQIRRAAAGCVPQVIRLACADQDPPDHAP